MPNTFDYIPDQVLERIYNEGGLNPSFYKTVRIRREYPDLSHRFSPRIALEILAERYYIAVETVKIYLWSNRYPKK